HRNGLSIRVVAWPSAPRRARDPSLPYLARYMGTRFCARGCGGLKSYAQRKCLSHPPKFVADRRKQREGKRIEKPVGGLLIKWPWVRVPPGSPIKSVVYPRFAVKEFG